MSATTGNALPPIDFDLGHDPFRPTFVDVDARHGGTRFGQLQRGLPAVAGPLRNESGA